MSKEFSCYHPSAFDYDKRTAAIKRITKILRRFPRTVGIACTGISGITLGTLVAHQTKRELIVVRKGESTHSMFKVEGYTPEQYVIVDDFMDSGHTIRRITQEMRTRHIYAEPKPSECVGVILYNGTRNDSRVDSIEINNESLPVYVLSTAT